MATKAYGELLRDPRWQRKRLEVMQRAAFKCEACGAHDRTLNVHHGRYDKGRAPWEYDIETLWCLCETCHERTERTLSQIKAHLAVASPAMLSCIAGYLAGLASNTGRGGVVTLPSDELFIIGLAEATGFPFRELVQMVGATVDPKDLSMEAGVRLAGSREA